MREHGGHVWSFNLDEGNGADQALVVCRRDGGRQRCPIGDHGDAAPAVRVAPPVSRAAATCGAATPRSDCSTAWALACPLAANLALHEELCRHDVLPLADVLAHAHDRLTALGRRARGVFRLDALVHARQVIVNVASRCSSRPRQTLQSANTLYSAPSATSRDTSAPEHGRNPASFEMLGTPSTLPLLGLKTNKSGTTFGSNRFGRR